MTAVNDVHNRHAETPWHRPPRALPIPTPPQPSELIESFVRRLAAANHTDPEVLINHLGHRHGERPKTNPVDLLLNRPALDRLAIYSGSAPAAVLAATNTELLDTANDQPTTRWAALAGLRLVHPCPRCTARRCVDSATVTIGLNEHQPALCLAHATTLATTNSAVPPRSLSHFPDIIAAGRRHNSLQRKRANTIGPAYATAIRLTRDWRPVQANRRTTIEHIQLRWQTRATRLQLPDTHEVVRYPETVALADLLGTLPWAYDTAGLPTEPLISAPIQFLLQAAQHLNHPEPRDLLKPGHPLNRWLKVPQRPRYWWFEQGPEPDRTAFLTLSRARKPLRDHTPPSSMSQHLEPQPSSP